MNVLNAIRQYRKSLLFVALLIYLSVVYLPLILKGGIIVDDWGNLGQNWYCTHFLNCYLDWFPLFSNRPLAPIPIVLSTMLFGMHVKGYLALNSLVYLGSLGLLVYLLKRVIGALPALGFLMLAAVPVIAMPIVSSPINCLVQNTSFLYWVVSLFFLVRYCETRRFICYFATYFFLLLSLLTYEIILPLLALTAIFPYLLQEGEDKKFFIRTLVQFISPLIFIVVLVVIWQKIIAPELFSVVYSRLEFSWARTYWGVDGWLAIFYEKLPNLFIKLFNLYRTQTLWIFFGVIATFVIIYKLISRQHEKTGQARLFLVGAVLVCLGCYVLFALGGAKEVEIGGYGARILSSTWLALALLLAALLAVMRGILRKFIIGLLILFTALSCAAFVVSRDQYIASWQLQQRILTNVIQSIQKQGISGQIQILGDVPQYLDKNFNNEIVFSTPWDFGFALQIFSQGQITGAAVIDSARGIFHELKLQDQGVLLDGYWKAAPPNLWFYAFDAKTQASTLRPLSNSVQLNRQLLALGYLGELGKSSTIELGAPISFAKNWLNRPRFIGPGWFGEIESWGGIWSAQGQAEILLPMPTSAPSSIQFLTNALVNTKLPVQRVEISLNGQMQKIVSLNLANDNLFTLPIPISMREANQLAITFRFLDATSPKALGMNDDPRTLAMGLKTITFF